MSRIDLNNNWLFTPAWSEGFCTGTESAEHLQEVRLPHTCREVPFHYFDESLYQMVCGYRRTVSAPESWAGKRVLLHIGAAGHSADVFLNGTHIGGHRCGYTAFTVELTGHLLTGRDNMLAIRVDSRESQDFPPFGYVIDYMTYGGLYREVSLEVLEPVYLEDVFAKPIITAGLPQEDQDHVSAMLESEIMLNGAAENAGTLYIRQKLYEGRAEDAEKLSAETLVPAESLKTETRTVHGEERRVHILEMKSTAVRLWSVERPLLYSLRTELLCVGGGEETLLDSRITTLGFRSAVFYRDGFYLNGRKLKLIGLNRHQSWPYVGYAMPASQQRLDADILKFELGLNAVRTSHYPQSQAFLDRCDEIGLLVFTEIPGWQHIGGEEWKKQAVRNVEDMVLQDRAHPSVILWGVRINESVDDDPLYEKTNAVARALDPTRQTSGVRCYKRSHLLEDVYAYNDFSHNGTNGGCEKKKNVTSDPDRPYFISESNGHMFPTKAFDSEGHRQAHALRHATVVDAALGEEDIAGVFGWCMFDYNTHKDFGSGDRICYHGVMDMFRNPKLAAALYSSQQEETPVLEISSGMNMGERPEGSPGKIYLFTNADEVRFYKNDRLVKAFKPEGQQWKHLKHPPILIDDYVADEMGEKEGFAPDQEKAVRALINRSAVYGLNRMPLSIMLKAAKLMMKYHMTFEDAYRLYGAYIGNWGKEAVVYRFDAVKDGKVVKTIVRSATTGMHLEARPDHTDLADGATYDVCAIRLSVRDQNGAALPFYQGSVTAELQGPIEIYGGTGLVTLRGGAGGLYIRTTGEPGEASVTLKVEQTEPVTIRFTVRTED